MVTEISTKYPRIEKNHEQKQKRTQKSKIEKKLTKRKSRRAYQSHVPVHGLSEWASGTLALLRDDSMADAVPFTIVIFCFKIV